MIKTKRSSGKVGLVLCGALVLTLTGCTTYVEHRPVRTVYVPPPPVVYAPPPALVIQTESDFYEPLNPHGEWVVVGSYGRCWKPTRVEVGWRPYSNGHWRRTDAGWYWASDEPWGWATYHYGRWDFNVRFGWFWVPQTQWAPAWVSWRQGAGYVGWAPLPPSARIGTRGIVEVHDRAFAPHAFVFVSEQRLLEPVRPTTVIVNNSTVINQTINITKIHVANDRTVVNEGPRPEVIERKSGRKVEAIPVHELRRREETEVASRRRNIPSTTEEKVQPPVRTESAPPRTVPAREPRQTEKPVDVTRQPQPPTTRNEVRKPAEQKPAPPSARPEEERPGRNEKPQEIKGEKTRPEAAPVDTVPKGRPEAKPPIRSREPRQVEQPAEVRKQPQLPVRKNEIRATGTGELKPSGAPARPEVGKPLGNERQRELQRAKGKPETAQPATSKRGEVKKKKDDKKKSEEKETPPEQSPAPRPPK